MVRVYISGRPHDHDIARERFKAHSSERKRLTGAPRWQKLLMLLPRGQSHVSGDGSYLVHLGEAEEIMLN